MSDLLKINNRSNELTQLIKPLPTAIAVPPQNRPSDCHRPL